MPRGIEIGRPNEQKFLFNSHNYLWQTGIGGQWNQPIRRRAKAGYLVTDTPVSCELAVGVVTMRKARAKAMRESV